MQLTHSEMAAESSSKRWEEGVSAVGFSYQPHQPSCLSRDPGVGVGVVDTKIDLHTTLAVMEIARLSSAESRVQSFMFRGSKANNGKLIHLMPPCCCTIILCPDLTSIFLTYCSNHNEILLTRRFITF